MHTKLIPGKDAIKIYKHKKEKKENQFCKKKNPNTAIELVLSPEELAERSRKSYSDQTNDEDISNHHMEPSSDHHMEPSSSLFSASASELERKYSNLESESDVERTERLAD